MSNDLWVKKLEEEKLLLQQCQTDKHLKSCLPCEKLNDCKIRDSYVKAVYDSMSKGVGGGFEF